MAAGDKLGTTSCDCGGRVVWTEGKSGGASGVCTDCSEQRFKRSPKSMDGLKSAIAAGKPASPSSSDSGGFDLTKL